MQKGESTNRLKVKKRL
jgi:hypothetical protein